MDWRSLITVTEQCAARLQKLERDYEVSGREASGAGD